MAKKTDQLMVLHEAPHDLKVFKAFSLEEYLCQGKLNQVHTIPVDACIFIGYERFFKTVEKAVNLWPCLSLKITLDEKNVFSPKDQTIGPYAFSLLCSKNNRTGFVVGTAIYVPTLSLGDHHIAWRTKADCDIDDGWTVTPSGTVEVFSAILQVINKHSKEY